MTTNVYSPCAWHCAKVFRRHVTHSLTHSLISSPESPAACRERPAEVALLSEPGSWVRGAAAALHPHCLQFPALCSRPGVPGQRPLASSHSPDQRACCAPNLEAAALWAGGTLPPPGVRAWGCSFVRVYRGDIFGRPGCLAGKIHQPASSTLASLNHVLICQSVGFLYTYSSIFVSGEIAFVFLCLLINPSVDLRPPHSACLVSGLEIELGVVVTPSENNSRSPTLAISLPPTSGATGRGRAPQCGPRGYCYSPEGCCPLGQGCHNQVPGPGG